MVIRKILVANRGEIAVRIQRTCREMGIATVAVYSDPDRSAPHTLAADEAVRLGGGPAAESYLNIERLVEAAKRTGAQAVHPGYGFLSESAAFARAVRDAGLVFIGPSPEAIAAMGDKAAAKALARKAGVPVVPGYEGDSPAKVGHLNGASPAPSDPLLKQAKAVGLPLLVKAAAGGGGKGMRLVRHEKDLAAALEGASREAQRAFGNGALLLEKYLENARHVEVQIFGDRHGNVLHLGERECSLQRRHQKILEECPSPGVSREVARKMCESAVSLARAIRYEGAGTVEFLVDASGAFYFLEMNTRLQVEHPVTEMVTGLDLVRWQIDVAAGKPLPLTQQTVKLSGHAVEARLYAEDPASRFQPAAGDIVAFEPSPPVEGVRIDAGVAAGDRVGIDYDPMLAKVIAHGEDRLEALGKLEHALRRLVVLGPTTNKDFLTRLIADPDVRNAVFSTGFVEENVTRWLPGPHEEGTALAIAAATIHRHFAIARRESGRTAIPPGYRNNPYRYPSVEWGVGAERVGVSFYAGPGRELHVFARGRERVAAVVMDGTDRMRIEIDGVQRDFRFHEEGETLHVSHSGSSVALKRLPRFPREGAKVAAGGVRAPMTGRVTRLLKAAGEAVSEGDPLLVLEAMKMEQTVHATQTGRLEAVLVKEGDTVEMGVALVKMEDAVPAT